MLSAEDVSLDLGAEVRGVKVSFVPRILRPRPLPLLVRGIWGGTAWNALNPELLLLDEPKARIAGSLPVNSSQNLSQRRPGTFGLEELLGGNGGSCLRPLGVLALGANGTAFGTSRLPRLLAGALVDVTLAANKASPKANSRHLSQDTRGIARSIDFCPVCTQKASFAISIQQLDCLYLVGPGCALNRPKNVVTKVLQMILLCSC